MPPRREPLSPDRSTRSCVGSIKARNRQLTIGRSSPISTSRISKPGVMRSAPSPRWPLAKTGNSQSAASAGSRLATKCSTASLARSMPSRFRRTTKHWPLPAAHRGSTESPRCSTSKPAKTPRTHRPSRRALRHRLSPDGNQLATAGTTASSTLGSRIRRTAPHSRAQAPFTASRSAGWTCHRQCRRRLLRQTLEHLGRQRLDTFGQPTGEQFLTAFTPIAATSSPAGGQTDSTVALG